MGGDCLNTGCVPSKSLIAAGKRARSVAEARAFGVQAAPPDIDFALVHRHVHDVIATIAPIDSKERFTGLGVNVIEGTARFKDPDTVAVGDAIEVKARRFVIATGSSPAVPPIPGLDTTPHLTNETVFDLTARPEHLLVIGAGPIGLELAQAFRRLGSEVTVVEAAEPLAREDPECAAVVIDQLTREGITLRTSTAVVRVAAADGAKIQIVVRNGGQEETIEGSHLLVATGRRTNIAGLDLERAGIKFDRGGILVDKGLQDRQQTRLCHRRRRGRSAIHPPRKLSCRSCHPERAVSPAHEGERGRDPAGDLHGPGTGPCRADRGRGQKPTHHHPGAALALS